MEIPNHRRISILFILLLTSAFSAPPPPPPPSSDYGGDYDYDYTPTPPPPPPAPCNPYDSNTLLQIKQTLNNSIILSSWIPNTDCCNGWEYVACDYATGRVNVLIFYGNGWGRDDLPRILPPSVGNLTYLESLSFYNNAIGPIPSSLANLQHLQSLYLKYNQLTGPIPTFFGQMYNLSWLDLSGNRLTGPIPTSLSNAPSLYVLKLNNNSLTGQIPSSLGNLRNINNNVISIDLSYNNLSGPIPKSFGGVNFRSLFLSGNNLTGDASFVFGKDKGVWQIDLSGNNLSFNLSNIGVPPQLSWLGLSQNQIYGGLPLSLTTLYLSYFNVSYNLLCGPIPQGGMLQNFGKTAYFYNTCLCGKPLPLC